MINHLPGPLQGVVSLTILSLNTVFWSTLLFPSSLMRLLVPLNFWQRFWARCTDACAGLWVACNRLTIALTQKVTWDVTGLDNLRRDGWYLVLSNHQSWLDIVVLQSVFHRRIPFLKFFLKKELIWVPVLGLAWWALDFPFMKRYSKAFLEKHPHLKGRDLETTRKACEKFKKIPVSIMNFVEGTRFTVAKRLRQESPYQHLLRPRAAGIAYVLAAMGDQLDKILDVTIAYPTGIKSLWAFMCGRVDQVKVRIQTLSIPEVLRGDYFNDLEFREKFHQWLNGLWTEKDNLMASLVADPAPTPAG